MASAQGEFGRVSARQIRAEFESKCSSRKRDTRREQSDAVRRDGSRTAILERSQLVVTSRAMSLVGAGSARVEAAAALSRDLNRVVTWRHIAQGCESRHWTAADWRPRSPAATMIRAHSIGMTAGSMNDQHVIRVRFRVRRYVDVPLSCRRRSYGISRPFSSMYNVRERKTTSATT